MNPSKAATLVATLVEYAVKNINLAVDVLDLQREEFEEDEEFFDGVINYTSQETDDFIVETATSDPYIHSTIDALRERGYEVEDQHPDDDERYSDSEDMPRCEKLVEELIRLIGKKRAILMIMDEE